ncbi:glycosyltransferase [Arcticibacter tournemirensis]|uniref:Glycosyltransferase n=1 Tax=Arcticibacter tournemirensis TaxID=699437 RepID=A0A4Q0M7N9_9SPHI|nr:glycosyltransferase [Arcticibacter tournemirensis]RXF69121.1 glycosyltransferase [Arcticibacter tournemirensis]
MGKYIFLQNILTPYRISLFDELYKCGFNFEVYYMRETEADRSWIIDKGAIMHPFYLDKGLYKMYGRFHLHFNIRIIAKILNDRDSEFILGGSWNDLNVLLLVFLKRIGILRSQLHFWSEANYLTIGALNDNWFKRALRKFVFDSSKGALIVPGKMSEMTFSKWKIKNKNFIRLPNTIEEELFKISNEEVNARFNNEIPIFFLPVRLIEHIKGIINFFMAIGYENIRKGIFWIAGEGPDHENIKSFVEKNDLNEHIKLLGHCDGPELVSLYKKANVFILPSFSDSSPLTLVEALIMKLPVLVSERCGNHYEAVVDNRNGFLFNPIDKNTIKNAFEALLDRIDDWEDMGNVSGDLYYRIFSRRLVINSFIKDLTEFSSRSVLKE